jgi:hypothetical protein
VIAAVPAVLRAPRDAGISHSICQRPAQPDRVVQMMLRALT